MINDWRVANLNCRVVGFKKLAEDVLSIAVMMKDKKANGVYDLDRLFKEKQLEDLHNLLTEVNKQQYINETAKKI